MDDPRLVGLSPGGRGRDRVLVYVGGYLSQDDEGPGDLAPWVAGLRTAGWEGRMVQLWWDASNAKGAARRLGIGHWGKVVHRAEAVGRDHGPRLLACLPEPEVTLVGFSLGARVVFETLCRIGPGRVRDAVLVGGAVDRDHKPPERDWVRAGDAVSHRLLTVANRHGAVLQGLYRRRHKFLWKGTSPVGLKPVDVFHPKIEHHDLTDAIDSASHAAYPGHLHQTPLAAWWRSLE